MKVVRNQTTEIIKHLKTKKSITSTDAIRLYGATRLASIIHNLRKRGYIIDTQMCVGKTRYGDPVNYAKYIYRGMEK